MTGDRVTELRETALREREVMRHKLAAPRELAKSLESMAEMRGPGRFSGLRASATGTRRNPCILSSGRAALWNRPQQPRGEEVRTWSI